MPTKILSPNTLPNLHDRLIDNTDVNKILSPEHKKMEQQQKIYNTDVKNKILSPNTTLIPKLEGINMLTAMSFIHLAGLKIGEIKEKCNDTVPAGVVISQGISADNIVSRGKFVDLVLRGTSVDLIVSSGPCNDNIINKLMYDNIINKLMKAEEKENEGEWEKEEKEETIYILCQVPNVVGSKLREAEIMFGYPTYIIEWIIVLPEGNMLSYNSESIKDLKNSIVDKQVPEAETIVNCFGFNKITLYVSSSEN